MHHLIFTLALALATTLYAQFSNNQTSQNSENFAFQFGFEKILNDIDKSNQQAKFCKENTVRLNLLIQDDYFVFCQQEWGKLHPDTLVTKIYAADTSKEHPAWARVYGVKQATPDSVIRILKEKYLQNRGKADREELLISYPFQDKSIYSHKKFINDLKKIGYTKIRLVGYNKEFKDEVYRKLQIKKYSAKQLESWESSKNHCNKDWLRIIENNLTFGKKFQKIIDVGWEPNSGTRSWKNIKDVTDRKKKNLYDIQKKFKNALPRLKDVTTPEHPDAETQIKIILKFVIDSEGYISKMEKISSNSQNGEFDQQICNEVSKWTFEKAKQPTTETTPFLFNKN